MEIFEKRGKWCFRDADGKLHKFNTKEALAHSLGTVPEVEEEEEEVCYYCECNPCVCEEEDDD